MSQFGCALEAEVRAMFPEDPERAVAVAWRESRCDPTAVNLRETCGPNGGRARGLMQLCDSWHLPRVERACPGRDPVEAILDAVCNLRASRELYEEQGWHPWGG